MKKIRNIILLLILMLFIFLLFDNLSTVYAKEKLDFSDERVLITLDNETSKKNKKFSIENFPEVSLNKIVDLSAEVNSILSNKSNELAIDNYNQTLCLQLKNKGKSNVVKAIEKLKNRKEVVAISPDYIIESLSTSVNDAYSNQQWAIKNINLSDAWNITTGSSFVSVGVIDSGIQSGHSDISCNIDISKSATIMNGKISSGSTILDECNHGTHVAGIIGAKGNNAKGIAGCNWNIKLSSLKIIDENGKGYSSDLILALNYATLNNISILNFSGSWLSSSSMYNSPVNKAIANYPGLFVCSAGNDNVNIDNDYCYPATLNLPNLITVGSLDENNEISSFSNYGNNSVDVFAPGSNIYSLNNNYSYESKSGTSMATPYVTGVAALIKSIRPDYSTQELKKCILNNVDKLENLNGYCKSGGKLNAYKAVRAATEQQTFTADVNGDGYNDIIMSGKNNNNKRVITTLLGDSKGNFSNEIIFTSTRNFYYYDKAFVGDFNGDSKCDIIVMWNNGGYRQLLLYMGNDLGTFNEGVNLYCSKIHDSYLKPYQAIVMDVDNDFKDDFVISYKENNGKRSFIVYKGTDTSPFIIDSAINSLDSNFDYFDTDIYKGDFNGDGYDDILVPSYNENYKRELIIYKGNNDGSFNEGRILTSTRNHLPEIFEFEYLVGDINGDNKTDFIDIFIDNNFRNSLTYKGCNSSPYIIDSIYDTMLKYENVHNGESRFLGDINGDGNDDLIIHYANANKKRTFDIFKGDVNGNFESSITTTTSNTHDISIFPTSLYLSDINNDGRKDFIVKWKNGDNCVFYVYKGKSNLTFEFCSSRSVSTKFYLG